MKTVKLHIKISLLSAILLIFSCASNGQNDNEEINIESWLTERVLPLESEVDLEPLIEAMKGAQLALLGEASHGTHEYYYWRDLISRKLISDLEFDFIAVEGDWAHIYKLNRYVLHQSDAHNSAREAQLTFDRWPEWMWANEEFEALAEWLYEYNADRPLNDRVGLYGMDVYAPFDAMNMVEQYVEEALPAQSEEIAELYSCLRVYESDEWQYARAFMRGRADCSDHVETVYSILTENRNRLESADRYAFLGAWQAALVVKNAENYYRSATRGENEGWNSRVNHMYETVKKLQAFKGEEAKGIVWAHNTHVGDARATSMKVHGRTNIGQLSRQEMGEENVFITGFSTYRGNVLAGNEWGAEMQNMEVPPAIDGSIDKIFHNTGLESFLWIIDEEAENVEPFRERLGHRAIGVMYNPQHDHLANYVPTIVPKRYDALLFFNETNILNVIE